MFSCRILDTLIVRVCRTLCSCTFAGVCFDHLPLLVCQTDDHCALHAELIVVVLSFDHTLFVTEHIVAPWLDSTLTFLSLLWVGQSVFLGESGGCTGGLMDERSKGGTAEGLTDSGAGGGWTLGQRTTNEIGWPWGKCL